MNPDSDNNRQNIPPNRAVKFLRWFCREDYLEEIEGDLTEIFEMQSEESPKKAKRRFIWSVIRYFRPEFIKSFKTYYQANTIAMIQHNFLLAFRNFKRYKSSFIINLTGLSTGIACALLIFIWVNDELNIDKFHVKGDRIYQLMENQQHSGSIRSTRSTPWLLAESLADEIPEVTYASVATPTGWFEKFTLQVEDNITKATGIYTGEDYFSIFSYEILLGDKNKVLMDKNSIVISEELAYRLFNTTKNVIGRSIRFQQESDFYVSGVFEDITDHSSTRFDFVLSVELLKDQHPEAISWKNSGPYTYVLLKEGSSPTKFNEKISDYIKTKTVDTHRSLISVPYTDNYLHGNYVNGKQSGGRIEYIRLFSITAIIILIIACINFMNLSTARASRRIKEVAMKKTMGANRWALVFQYLTESTTLVFLALFVAALIVILILPQFNLIMGKRLIFDFKIDMFLTFLGILLFTGLLAGSYPAIYLSGFNPIMVLKGKLGKGKGETWARKGLVIFQFAISVIFIVAVMVVYRQITFVQNKNIGYDKDNVIYFEIEGKSKQNLEALLAELENIPGVLKASSAGQSMVGGGNTSKIDWEGKDPNLLIPFAYRPANYGLMELLKMEIVEGRVFSPEHADSLAVIFNESGIKAMSMNEPIGKSIDFGGMDCRIVGVVKDFNFTSLRQNIDPLFFILAPEHTEKVFVRVESERIAETLERLKQFYTAYNPGFTFDFRFLDQDYQEQYISEKRVSDLSKYFAFIAILISCLGLFGLAAFTVERRIKEIGIRKILGAKLSSVVGLLSIEFTKMVLIAILIALPISYLIAQSWLENFAFSVDLHWWYFVLSGLIALSIAWLTVGLQTIKAARINPVDSLRDE